MTEKINLYDENGELLRSVYADEYNETEQAEATSRNLDADVYGDFGYHCEFVGYGKIDGIDVKAVYLFEKEEFEDVEELDQLDWESALKRFMRVYND